MDCRDSIEPWFNSFDERKMIILFEDDEGVKVELPAKFEVCSVCRGRGTHVNPNIDRYGLTAEDFAEDPDFAESYFNGVYDMTCNRCHGRRVEPVINTENCSEEQLKLVEEIQVSNAQSRAEDRYWSRLESAREGY